MKNFLFLATLFISTIGNIFGQPRKNETLKRITTSDSVILVSHLATYAPEKDKSFRLVEKGKVNNEIIIEQYRLKKSEIDSLAVILITRNTDSILVDIQCFIPHHGILIFEKGKCSFFDICFGCRHFVTSKDIKLSDELCEKTWNDLEFFFRNRNLSYKMPGKETENEGIKF